MIWIILGLAAIVIPGAVLHRLALRRRRRERWEKWLQAQQRWEKWQRAKRENGWTT